MRALKSMERKERMECVRRRRAILVRAAMEMIYQTASVPFCVTG